MLDLSPLLLPSSSGVGGRGREGPLPCAWPWLGPCLGGSSGPVLLRCGNKSLRGLGFLTLASMVPSLRTGASSSLLSSSTISLSSAGLLLLLLGTLCLSLCLGGPGEGTRSCRCLASSSSWSVGFLGAWLGVTTGGVWIILEFLCPWLGGVPGLLGSLCLRLSAWLEGDKNIR